jgi:ketosteroid isomerase-like protein
MRGRAAIAEAFRSVESPEIVAYALDIQEVKVLGDHAFQWGTYHYTMRPRGRGETVRTSGKLMRILQRQPDGSWKMHRGMSTVDAPTATARTAERLAASAETGC